MTAHDVENSRSRAVIDRPYSSSKYCMTFAGKAAKLALIYRKPAQTSEHLFSCDLFL